MRQDQGIKGFTLLELIVAVLIISIVSAIAYPGYSSWKKDREVRAATEKVASLIANISTLTQRGSFAYSQLLILPKDVIVIILKYHQNIWNICWVEEYHFGWSVFKMNNNKKKIKRIRMNIKNKNIYYYYKNG